MCPRLTVNRQLLQGIMCKQLLASTMSKVPFFSTCTPKLFQSSSSVTSNTMAFLTLSVSLLVLSHSAVMYSSHSVGWISR